MLVFDVFTLVSPISLRTRRNIAYRNRGGIDNPAALFCTRDEADFCHLADSVCIAQCRSDKSLIDLDGQLPPAGLAADFLHKIDYLAQSVCQDNMVIYFVYCV